MSKTDLKSLNREELEEFIISLGEKPFRGRQVYAWLHRRLASSFDEMTDISRGLKDTLENCCSLTLLRTETVQESKEDGTRKYLFAL